MTNTLNLERTGLAGLLGFGIASCLSASVMYTVPGSADIFLAGQTSSPGGGAGVLPQELDFNALAGNVLSFTGPGITLGTAVTGLVSPCPPCSTAGPDGADLGSQLPATSIGLSTTNLSQIQYTGDEMFLVGVFLTGAPGSGVGLGSQVTSIGNYGPGGTISVTQTTYIPIVGQTFFIGDGLTGTGSGAIQQFTVPTGATRLFLGIADAANFVGQAGMYSDNTGNLTVNLQIMPTIVGAVPEPGTIVFLVLGLAGLARKRFSQSWLP